MAKRGKKDASNGGGAQKPGGSAQKSSRSQGKDDKKSVDPRACIGRLSRKALEDLVLGSLSKKFAITEDDLNALMPAQNPKRREGRVGDDETVKNLGLFSSVPTVIVLDILMRLNLEMRLNCCIGVCKGFRIFAKDPSLFHTLTNINTNWISSSGFGRLFDWLPGAGTQVFEDFF